MTIRRRLLVFFSLFVLSFGIRLGYVLKSNTPNSADEMVRAARCFAEHGFIGNVYSETSGPSAHVAPVYPVLLSIPYSLFGADTSTGYMAQQILAILGTSLGIGLLPFLAARGGFSSRVGICAAVLVAVVPLNLWIETAGSWEQPWTALALICLGLLLCKSHDQRWTNQRHNLLTGAVLGISALLSPTVLPVIAIVLFGELISLDGWRVDVVKGMAVLIPTALLIIAPWVIRNANAVGGFIPIRSNFGLELLIGNNPESDGKTFTKPYDDPEGPFYQLHPFMNPVERARLEKMGERAWMQDAQQRSMQWIRENPGYFARHCLHRARLYWVPPPHMWGGSGATQKGRATLFGFLGLLTLGGLAYLFIRQHDYRWFWLALVVGPSLVYLITHVNIRYRYPIYALSVLVSLEVAARYFWRATKAEKPVTA